jgi:hypothetical protein
MSEYITKEAAIEVFEWGDADVIEDYGDGCDFGFSRGAIKSAINTIPAADVAPVVHGRWVSVAGKRDRICSRCLHNEPYKNADDDAEVFEFCPHCGAKMDGGDSDEAD